MELYYNSTYFGNPAAPLEIQTTATSSTPKKDFPIFEDKLIPYNAIRPKSGSPVFINVSGYATSHNYLMLPKDFMQLVRTRKFEEADPTRPWLGPVIKSGPLEYFTYGNKKYTCIRMPNKRMYKNKYKGQYPYIEVDGKEWPLYRYPKYDFFPSANWPKRITLLKSTSHRNDLILNDITKEMVKFKPFSELSTNLKIVGITDKSVLLEDIATGVVHISKRRCVNAAIEAGSVNPDGTLKGTWKITYYAGVLILNFEHV